MNIKNGLAKQIAPPMKYFRTAQHRWCAPKFWIGWLKELCTFYRIPRITMTTVLAVARRCRDQSYTEHWWDNIAESKIWLFFNCIWIDLDLAVRTCGLEYHRDRWFRSNESILMRKIMMRIVHFFPISPWVHRFLVRPSVVEWQNLMEVSDNAVHKSSCLNFSRQDSHHSDIVNCIREHRLPMRQETASLQKKSKFDTELSVFTMVTGLVWELFIRICVNPIRKTA